MDNSNTPPKQLGKEFEAAILYRALKLETQGLLTMGKYGVQANIIDHVWTPVASYPDFEGVIQGGKQFIIEAKACSAASFTLSDKTHFKGRQYRHMRRRALFGVPCYLLIHWNRRVLKTKEDEAMTTAIPVHPALTLWSDFEAGTVKSLTRAMAQEHGVIVPWNLATPRVTKMSPDLSFLLAPTPAIVG